MSLFNSSVRISMVLAVVFSTSARASLEDEMKALDTPENRAPGAMSSGADAEKFYSVQSRYVSLHNRSEIDLSASQLLNGNGFLVTRQFGAGYRFHLGDHWNLGVQAAWATSNRSSAGERLYTQDGLIPDAAYIKSRYDAALTYNLFYGKFRVSMDQVFYFDQYVSLGGGMINLDRGSSAEGLADVGFAFWLGRSGALRLGMKNYFYNEKRRLSSGFVHDMNGYLEIGILLGKGNG